MSNAELMVAIDQLQKEIASKQQQLDELRGNLAAEPVENYLFLTKEAEITLSELFGEYQELIVIHNMGTHCSYCTMWADGFSGIYPQLAEKVAFVISSPDTPAKQQEFAEERGWIFPMVSTANEGNTFRKDCGFQTEEFVYPGLSVFLKQADGQIIHHTHRIFGPGDNFGVLWHLLDLLPTNQ